MKFAYRRSLLGIPLLAFLFALSSCREDITKMLNPDSLTTNEMRHDSFYEQMVTIWEGINTSYVFWKIDTVDWDARRERMFRWAKDLDRRMEDEEEINIGEEMLSFMALFNGLVDHHMTVCIKNPYTYLQDTLDYFYASPHSLEVFRRQYTHREISFSNGYRLLNEMKDDSILSLSYFAEAQDDEIHAMSCIINDCIAYLRMTNYAILSESDHSDEVDTVLFAHFRRIKELKGQGKLKGIILDNRGNSGGYASDLKWVVGLYIQDPVVCQYFCTKNGLGRYDYTPEQPFTIPPYFTSPYYVGDLGEIKYVALEDINSASMGELTGNAISQLPYGCTIGDRTLGAHGALNPSMFDGTWTGSFAYNLKDMPFVYTSTYLARTWDWQNKKFDYFEGKGHEPMIKWIVTENPYSLKNDPQLLRAVQYIYHHY